MDHAQDLNYYQIEIKNLRNQNQRLMRIAEIVQQTEREYKTGVTSKSAILEQMFRSIHGLEERINVIT